MRKIKPIFWIYVLSMLLVLHIAVPIYVNSTYLSTFTTDDIVGLIYSVGSIFTIFSLIAVSKALERFGNYKTTLFLIAIEILALAGLAASKSFTFIIIAFLLHFSISTIIGFNTDVFIEKYSKDASTGGTRGLLFSLTSIAWLVSPLLAGFLLLDTANYWIIYVASILFLIPALLVLTKTLDRFKDPQYHHISFWKDVYELIKDKNKRYIVLSSLMLKLFFAWMVIYTPLYLNKYIGFDFKQIGFIFSVMMLAYILFEWPVGLVSDKKYGEKELLGAGFVVLAITTAFLSFIQVPNIFIWIIALFLTRVGAAMVEATTESYFFKKITSADTDDLSFWKMLRPIGYLIAPLIMTPFLIFFDFRYIFLGMAGVTLLGVLFVLPIKDTK